MRLAVVVAWTAFVLLLAGASPGHFWLDSAEIGAAGYDLGVMHPPGAPGYTLLLRASTLLPWGSIGFRMAVLSCALAAACLGGVVAWLREREVPAPVAVAVASGLLVSGTFARQARVVEIYALQGFLLVVAVWGFTPASTNRQHPGRKLVGVMAAVWATWCFADARLSWVLPVAGGWAWARSRGRVWARWAPAVTVMMSAVALSLALSSLRAPMADWGDPDSLARWWDHVMARSIREAYAGTIWPQTGAMWRLNAETVRDGLHADMGAIGLAVGLCAVVALLLRPARARAELAIALGVMWLVVVQLIYAIAINPMGVRDRQTGVPLAVLLALAVGELAGRWTRTRPRWAWGVAVLWVATVTVPGAKRAYADAANTRSWGATSWTRGALAQLPAGSLLLTQSDDLAAGVLAAQVIEGARPDVAAIAAQHLYKPVPDWVAPGTALHRAWTAAADKPDEASRIVAAIAAHDGPVAVEGAATTVFGAVPWWAEAGQPPLRVAPPEPIPMGTAAATGSASTRASTRAWTQGWLARMDAPEDRRRLAWALASDARGRMRATQDAHGAKATFEHVIAELSTHEPAVWVGMGALQDRFGQRERAIESTRRALELEPGRARALTNLSLFLARDRTTLGEAKQLAQWAVALRPHDPLGWMRLATACELLGDDACAAAAQQRARGQQ